MTEILRVTGLSKSFGRHQVLRNVSLSAKKSDIICLIGSSGSGKSTFLRCLNFLERPNKGEMFLNGQPIELVHGDNEELTVRNNGQLRWLRSRLSMVFQNFNLWPHMTVLENVVLAQQHVLRRTEKVAVAVAQSCLKRAGFDDTFNNYYPAHLSGGQQQRVAIARALAMEPDILLFDEPTSALDPELVGDVLNTMKMLAEQGTTMILVTHEMDFARHVADHVLFLHQGEIEEHGSPEKLFNNPTSKHLKRFLDKVS